MGGLLLRRQELEGGPSGRFGIGRGTRIGTGLHVLIVVGSLRPAGPILGSLEALGCVTVCTVCRLELLDEGLERDREAAEHVPLIVEPGLDLGHDRLQVAPGRLEIL